MVEVTEEGPVTLPEGVEEPAKPDVTIQPMPVALTPPKALFQPIEYPPLHIFVSFYYWFNLYNIYTFFKTVSCNVKAFVFMSRTHATNNYFCLFSDKFYRFPPPIKLTATV